MENGPGLMYSLLKMVIFHCHVSLLEGKHRVADELTLQLGYIEKVPNIYRFLPGVKVRWLPGVVVVRAAWGWGALEVTKVMGWVFWG